MMVLFYFVPQSGNNLSDKHKPGAQNSGINFKQMAGQLWIVLCCNVVNILFPMFSGGSVTATVLIPL